MKKANHFMSMVLSILLGGCSKHLRRIVTAALLTGMRRGEILSLKWNQIRNGFISLDKTKTINLRYAHLSQEDKKKAVNLLNELTPLKNYGNKTGTLAKTKKVRH